MLNDFIELEQGAFSDIELACITSEFQKIDKKPSEVNTSDESGGLVFPDFYYDEAVPLFSEEVFKAMKNEGVDNLMTKSITVVDALQEKSKKYILGLPPRIRVLDSVGKIDEGRLGNYMIFKVLDSSDNSIYITQKLKDLFDSIRPLGMEIIEADVL